MHDAVPLVMTYIASLPDDERYPFVQLLPELCRNANAKTLRVVQARLKVYYDNYQGNKQHYYYQALARVRASIDQRLDN